MSHEPCDRCIDAPVGRYLERGICVDCLRIVYQGLQAHGSIWLQNADNLPLATVSSVRVAVSGHHDVVTVWNAGANAGDLTVRSGEGYVLALRLLRRQ